MPIPVLWQFGRLAAAMPYTNAVGDERWASYRVSVDEIEARTGFDL